MDFGWGIGEAESAHVANNIERLLILDEVALLVVRMGSRPPGVRYLLVTSHRLLGVDPQVQTARLEIARGEVLEVSPVLEGSLFGTLSLQMRDDSVLVLAIWDARDGQAVTSLLTDTVARECELQHRHLDRRLFLRDNRKQENAGIKAAKASGEWKSWKEETRKYNKMWERDPAADTSSTTPGGPLENASDNRTADRGPSSRLLIDEWFANKRIRIFEDGSITVSGFFGGQEDEFHQLLSIEDSSEVQKKSGAGRGAGMLLTGGLSILASNMRGDIYLTIVTDRRTWVLHQDPPTESGVKAAKKLAAVGRSVLSRPAPQLGSTSETAAVALPSAPPLTSISDRLKELKSLLDEGLITEIEFEEFRRNALEQFGSG